MMPEQGALLQKAEDSLRGARLLAGNGLYDFAVSRAYYTIVLRGRSVAAGAGAFVFNTFRSGRSLR